MWIEKKYTVPFSYEAHPPVEYGLKISKPSASTSRVYMVQNVVGPVLDGLKPYTREEQYRGLPLNMWYVPIRCAACRTVFFRQKYVYERSLKAGRPIFCSNSCAGKITAKKRTLPNPNVEKYELNGEFFSPKLNSHGRLTIPFLCAHPDCVEVFYRLEKYVHRIPKSERYCDRHSNYIGVRGKGPHERLGISRELYRELRRIHKATLRSPKMMKRRTEDSSLKLVTIPELAELFKKQGGRCAVTGLELFVDRASPSDGRGGLSKSPLQASLDRIDCDQDYTSENCHIVCLGFNYLKNNFPLDLAIEFLLACADGIRSQK